MSVAHSLIKLEDSFAAQNNFGLKFESECLFAKQQITKSDFVLSTAENSPDSLKGAILNVAAIGISLNPATAHAYLVPREGRICLDISYRGLVKLATDIGAIKLAKAVLVYEGDEFASNGPFDLPDHKYNPFDKDRSNAKDPLEKLVGGYCAAKLSDDTWLVEFMSADEIIEVRNSSKAYKSGKSCPWVGPWAGEMAKKTLVKRAYKSWPQSAGKERFDEAINILNQHEGLRLTEHAKAADYLQHSPEQKAQYDELLKSDPVDFAIWYDSLDDRIKVSLVNSFEHGEKGKMRDLHESVLNSGREMFLSMLAELTEACEKEDDVGVKELLLETPDHQYRALVSALRVELVRFAESIKEAA